MTLKNSIKFLDLKAINNRFEPQLSQTILDVVQSGRYLKGEQTEGFEKEFAAYIGTKHCIGLGNGTNALEIIFRAYLELGILKKNDEVLVPANTFFATFLAVINQGLVPVPIDPNLPTFLLKTTGIAKAISPRTKAMVMVHLYGRNAYHENIHALLKANGILLIEDNAQAVGSRYLDKKSGSLGDAAAHSFYPAKNLGAMGDAGAITTNQDQLAETCRALANYGSITSFEYQYAGTNSKMDEIQAAILRVKLPYLDEDNARRNHIALEYLSQIKHPKIQLPLPADPSQTLQHTWHLFTILVADRQNLMNYLRKFGIEAAIHYPTPPHRQPAFKASFPGKALPLTERIHRETLSLPLNQALTEKELAFIIDRINHW
ncbi:DegT/DnrJ/EryC1/StrS family aminotransferase [Cyclobacterium sp.]|uniref:DegT/DnrJ/EryC1/StrS family aminotransferase n=1 Tax=Cyclobacterium sp. TaxID=1966343 RepID=UPI001984369E|nr:DegT/DnrJ/EryC1/StrS family aminotransferase [Cyclobacterium sp.]MBD3628048.1 DegT/DnrJ/EryC1/StrS family aminotransferase [Cyclobacterium sp.]